MELLNIKSQKYNVWYKMKSIIIKNMIYKNVNHKRHVKVLWPQEEGVIYFYLKMNGKDTENVKL